MSSPWLKKRDNYGGNIGKNKKSSENFIDEGKKIKIINILQDKILVKKSR